MKHAGQAALESLALLLSRLRAHPALAERTPGAFYLRSKAFLHFHEDEAGFFADLEEDLASFSRHRVTTQAERNAFIAPVNRCLDAVALRSAQA